MKPKISIIIPIYNAERFLDECIQSVINQTDDSWELILVDDGSNDKSFEICLKYATQYPNTVFAYSKENEGQYKTRIFGIEKSSGDYLGFVDADDFIDKEYIEKIIKHITSHPNVDIICFGFYQWDGKIEKTKPIFLSEAQDYYSGEDLQKIYKEMISISFYGSMWTKVFNRDLITSCVIESGVVCNKKYGEDTFQSYNYISSAESILLSKDILYFYRSNPDGFSRGFESRDLDYFSTKYISEYLMKQMAKWNFNKQEHIQELYAHNFNETIYYFLNYYRSANSNIRRKKVLNHSWENYLLDGYDNYLDNNPFVRQSYLKIWKKIRSHRFFSFRITEKLHRIKKGIHQWPKNLFQ